MNVTDQYIDDRMALYNGDSCEVLTGIPSDSVHFEIYSPPFASLYTYSNSERDLGNCRTKSEFFEQFAFIVQELYRVLMPGRLMSVHCMNLPTSKERDGYIGIEDFRGDLIRLFQQAGFIYHSEVCIWKDPVIAMQRTKALGLLHKQIKKDSCMSRQGIPDYLVTMRKPGDNPERVTHTNESFPVAVWQRYASPIWMDINPSDTLNASSCRDDKDEKHICLAKGTMVLTKRGYIAIENVVPNSDEVLTAKGRWRPVVASSLTYKDADVIKVNAVGVPNLICTKSHRLLAKAYSSRLQKERIKDQKPKWVEAKDAENTYLVQKLPPIEDTNLTERECWIIGRWVADGHVDVRGHQYFVSIGSKKVDEFVENAREYIGSKCKGDENCYQFGLKSLGKNVRSVLKKIGKGAMNKTLPIEILSLDKSHAMSFLKGYLSGDGCYLKNGKIMASTISRGLMLSLDIIIQRAYEKSAAMYSGRPDRNSKICGREVHCHREWDITLSPHYNFNKVCKDETLKKVKSVSEYGKSDVYDIQVQDDESFVAEGCVVHNCPLQLTVIRRAINLWTNKGDTVLTPFMGIGSEAYVALQNGRRAVGVELKPTWYQQAVRNCKGVTEAEQTSLW